mmetsp:Transcript_40205/g.68420  ORF Transcript_40205/g.68420 Transcript_40205/m.68420 type:complete len:91 (+) Transcript_40205:96-368(+)
MYVLHFSFPVLIGPYFMSSPTTTFFLYKCHPALITAELACAAPTSRSPSSPEAKDAGGVDVWGKVGIQKIGFVEHRHFWPETASNTTPAL